MLLPYWAAVRENDPDPTMVVPHHGGDATDGDGGPRLQAVTMTATVTATVTANTRVKQEDRAGKRWSCLP
jgi:hypothetical protein